VNLKVDFKFRNAEIESTMLVCLCKGVSDRTIAAAIDAGADTVEAVGAVCGAGTGCGGCQEEILHMIGAGRGAAPIELARHAARCGACPRRSEVDSPRADERRDKAA
jgi:bacterioferritin-associated ferredoxin